MKRIFQQLVAAVSNRFNELSRRNQQTVIFCFSLVHVGILLGSIFLFNDYAKQDETGVLVLPVFKPLTQTAMKHDQLIPLGKMKGEIQGEFDSFYVAVDRDARIFVNRDIHFGPEAYTRGQGWEEITRSRLADYARQLSFIPLNQKSKSLKP